MTGRRRRQHVMRKAVRPGLNRRRGSAYILVLGVSMAVTVIGLSALTVARVTAREVTAARDRSEAQLLAFSAAEWAVCRMNTNSDWRTDLNGVTVEESFGRGTFRLSAVDEADGDLTDDSGEPATIIATGIVNDARHTLSLRVTMSGPPLPALSAALAAEGEVQVVSNDAATFDGGALSSNGTVSNSGTIYGDVEAAQVSGSGTVTGTVTVPSPAKQMPSQIVFDTYKAGATVVANPGTIRKQVLGPTSNPWGQPNDEGLYYIDTGGADLIIEASRIHGTLVVKCGNGKVVLREAVLLHNYREDYPVLIVDGDVEMSFDSNNLELREASWQTNFNPDGTAYEGESDGDTGDTYPNEIQGLVHVKGALTMKRTALVRGAVICEGTVTFDGNNKIVYSSSVVQSPPMGYHTGTGQVRPGLWQRVVE